MIAITGASGQLGRLVIQDLLRRAPASRILALARKPASVQDLGVQSRPADYERPETLAAALAGVDKLLLISSNEMGRRAAQHKAVIDAAREAGVKLLVYTSVLRADTSPLGLAPEHAETEAYLKASGIPFVILRNGWYTENYTASIPSALAHGAFLGSAGGGRIASAARADYAAAAAAVLLLDGQAGKTYELAGDTSYTLTDLAAEIARQSGKPVVYKDLPEAEFKGVLVGVGLPEGLAALLSDSDAGVAKGALQDEGRQLSRLIGRATTPMAVSVEAALKG
ncbi:SDR family oxidoreductase [Geothrix sp. 21YS21S-2]|uniref:SDR family oxidoreductase n=1 Tax=Geothrix sp. 21YS21S-2 TaxID=3068893 RepID=UPI0027B90456|nr:SDR family oxidoreductase [Geothrix sp. 21YS21S-2]